MQNLPSELPQSADSESGNPYRLSKAISLSNQEIRAALRAAVLVKASELAQFGSPQISAMALDAQMASGTAKIEAVAVEATVEVLLQPSAIARLLVKEPVEVEDVVVLNDDMLAEKPSEARPHSRSLVSKALEKLTVS